MLGIIKRLLSRRDVHPKSQVLEEIRDHLSPEQYEVVRSPVGFNLVVAGPGSGKTRTMVYWVYKMVEVEGIPPNKIAVLTFTREAAQEARERLRTFLGPEVVEEMFIGTFHAFGLRLLREAGVSGKVLAPEEAAILWREAGGTEAHLRKLGLYEGKGWALPDDLVPILERYQALKGDRLDFRDLVRLEVEANDGLHFVVDEFQDTDWAQLNFLKKRALSLFAVGDPNQAIYAWRGGDRSIILNFASHFPGARIHYLRENHRSARRVVEFANRIIPLIPPKGGATMIPVRKEEGEVRVRIVSYTSDLARFIEAEVAEALDSGEGFALLVRSNREVREWSEHLESLGLGIRGGGPSVAREILVGLMELTLFEDMRGVSRLLEIEEIPESFKRALLRARGPHHLWERGDPGSLRLLQGLHALQRVKRGRTSFPEERDALRRALTFDPATADNVLNFLFNFVNGKGERALEEAIHLLAEEGDRSFHSSVLTFHRSKGLEWDRVVVILPPGDRQLAPGDLLATFVAFTRARKRLVVLGQGSVPKPLNRIM